MSEYRVEPEELRRFVERLQAFEKRAELIAGSVDTLINNLGAEWLGTASDSNRTEHDQLLAVTADMRDGVARLRRAADTAYCNYGAVVALNTAMWP